MQLLLLSLAIFQLAIAASDSNVFEKRQTDRQAIVRRALAKKNGHFKRQASTAACASNVFDTAGNCCEGTLNGSSGLCCPATTPIYTQASGCCARSQIYNCVSPTLPTAGCCAGEVYNKDPTSTGPSGKCCATGNTVYVRQSDGTTQCCQGTLSPPDVNGHQVCTGTDTTRKRDLGIREFIGSTYDRPAMSLESDDRVMLNSELAAQYLVNNGRFSHDGMTYVDDWQTEAEERGLQYAFKKGASKLLPYIMPAMKTTFKQAYGTINAVSLSDTYEFHMDDVPDIWARIVADPLFAELTWNGMAFSRDTLYQLASTHPHFNETLVDLYR